MHITMVDRFIVEAAVTPVSDFPAPHGNTIIPDRALPLPNILDSDLSWYGWRNAWSDEDDDDDNSDDDDEKEVNKRH